MKPYKIQWQNTASAHKPWISFDPPILVIASNEASAMTFASSKLRNHYDIVQRRHPTRAVEITWDEYMPETPRT